MKPPITLLNRAQFQKLTLEEKQYVAAYCLGFASELMRHAERLETGPNVAARLQDAARSLEIACINYGPPEHDRLGNENREEYETLLESWAGPSSLWPWA